jgi:signal transduction histidine kinase
VKDDGAGINQGVDAARVFDLGYTTKRGGAGVGLAVARSIVQGAGGQIELSARPGAHGCVLRVRFPGIAMGRKSA